MDLDLWWALAAVLTAVLVAATADLRSGNRRDGALLLALGSGTGVAGLAVWLA